nr:squalene/phytoene synthase family protein [Oligoflexia bacterium]
ESCQELLDYCDSVASAVGLCILAIMDLNRERYYDFALSTGRALQLTNIMRDLKEDAGRNRVYIPKEILQVSDCNEEQVLSGDDVKGGLTKMMIRMDKWAQEEYEKSEKFLFERIEDEVKSLPAQIMRKTYQCLLKKIRDKNYKVYAKKIKLSFYEKIYVLMWSFWHYCSYQVKQYRAKA